MSSSHHSTLRLGIAGLGTVGMGVIKIIQDHSELLKARTGKTLEITAVSARDASKDRGLDLNAYAWENDAVALAKRDDVDLFVELIGGAEGPAKEATQAALSRGIPVVTANKALLALHGQEFAELAESHGTTIRFEAAVAGGIPVIKALTESLAGNAMQRVMGVMNGTCNYILTRMELAGLTYEEAFAEANGLGYVEADPTLDVGGIDAAHKLALLSSVAFGTQVDFDAVELQGITAITIEDIKRADAMGYKIKLLGVAEMTEAGLQQSMKPCLVPAASPLGQLEGGTNMVVLEGDAVGQIVLRGAGAGEGPTASAVMGDICDLARGLDIPVFGQPASSLKRCSAAQSVKATPWYLRVGLEDTPGALAAVATVLGQRGVSIDRMRQSRDDTPHKPVLFVTHPCTPETLESARQALIALPSVAQEPVALQIQNL